MQTQRHESLFPCIPSYRVIGTKLASNEGSRCNMHICMCNIGRVSWRSECVYMHVSVLTYFSKPQTNKENCAVWYSLKIQQSNKTAPKMAFLFSKRKSVVLQLGFNWHHWTSALTTKLQRQLAYTCMWSNHYTALDQRQTVKQYWVTPDGTT